MHYIKKIKLLALTLLITGAIDSIRNLPASALFGSTLIFFFIFAAVFFLIPSSLVSAELAANVDEGGIFQWSRLAFGPRIGFLAVWLQWINNLVWFPTVLSFIAGTASYLINPELVHSRFYMILTIIILFWLLTLINLRGIRISSRITSFCAIVGLIIPMIVIIGLFIVWLLLHKPVQLDLTLTNIFPDFSQTENWMALTAIMLGFAGMELAAVHINDVYEPKKTFPKALAISTAIILVTMTLGSLAIAFVIPGNQINLVNGTMETFAYYLSNYHLEWFIPIMTLLLIIGSLGGIINWVIAPVKGLSQAASYGFLPPLFSELNAYGVPQKLLIAQAIAVTILSMAFLLLPTINAAFWLLTALTTQLYMLMYVILFLSGLCLSYKRIYSQKTFTIPGKKFGAWLVCLFGLIGCTITIVIGFIPPLHLKLNSYFLYEFLFITGMIALILPVFFLYWYQAKNGNRRTS